MKILAIPSSYPYPGFRFSGVFNEKSIYALSQICEGVEVLAPRPYAPGLLASVVPRWKAYASAQKYESRAGISVYRPMTPVIPCVAQAFWSDQGRFFWCRRTARKMHKRSRFDAIISFDLMRAGGLAWRLGRDLGIRAAGWATGSDVRVSTASAHGRAVKRALLHLDLVFYQSHELREKAAELLGLSPGQLAADRHVVLSRGIPEPPEFPTGDVRKRIRTKWNVKTNDLVVLYLGRILRQKGMVELLEAIQLAVCQDCRIRCVLIGSKPGFDDTSLVQSKLRELPSIHGRVTLLPECSPDSVWENLCAADIYAFPSHNEGMPNSLLEAMAVGLPSIAFAIPPVLEIEGGTGAVVLVPPLDSAEFGDAILRLATDPEGRASLGKRGKQRVSQSFMVKASMHEALRRLTMTRTQKP